ncbi:MAG: hypothetical protein KDB14_18280 [Planctomycetales bacterium]|nr:hypothetical protein [Planctomycetales bacterium]
MSHSLADDGPELHVRYELTDAEIRSLDDSPWRRRWQTFWLCLVHFGIPLGPSIVVLSVFGMGKAALAVAGAFLLLALVATVLAKFEAGYTSAPLELLLSPNFVDVYSVNRKVRRSWRMFDLVVENAGWLHLQRKGERILSLPNRVLGESDEQRGRLVGQIKAAIERRETAPIPQFPFDKRWESAPFYYQRDELQELFGGAVVMVDESGESQRRGGCLMPSVLVMLGAAVVISQVEQNTSTKIVMWVAASVAIWLPRGIWLVMSKWRVQRYLESMGEFIEMEHRHILGTDGLAALTPDSLDLWRWERITKVSEHPKYLFFHAGGLHLFATPKRTLVAPGEALDYARQQLSLHDPEQQRLATESIREEQPGPASETGNPYQPPLS